MKFLATRFALFRIGSESERAFCYVERVRLLTASILALGVWSDTWAALRVGAITGKVVYVRPASPEAKPQTTLEHLLYDAVYRERAFTGTTTIKDNDELRGKSDDSALQLECESGATQTLSGQFDVIVHLDSSGTWCRTTVRAGIVIATTSPDANPPPDSDPSIQMGDYTVGASSTQFGVTVTDNDRSAFVIDGSVAVMSKTGGTLQNVQAGQEYATKANSIRPIDPAAFDRYATVYAKLDVLALPAAQRATTEVQLKSAYLQAFRNPSDGAAHAEVNRVHVNQGLTHSAVQRYNEARVKKLQSILVVPPTAGTRAGGADAKASTTASPMEIKDRAMPVAPAIVEVK